MRNRLREKRPKQLRIGAMQVEKTRHSEPSYARSLVAAGIIKADTSIDAAWGIWTAVCGDTEFIRMSIAVEKSKRVFLPSVASPFSNGVQVLKAMNQKQLDALKQRIGLKRER
jgi:hypothetical protein